MAPYKCRQCPHRGDFTSRAALIQHYRDAANHFFCYDCERCFGDEDAFDLVLKSQLSSLPSIILNELQHKVTAHQQFKFICSLCKTRYATQSALEDHYRGKAIHPNCPRCGKGFFNQPAADEVSTPRTWLPHVE
jgi:hypothetical protein